jgi:hypothetical protein
MFKNWMRVTSDAFVLGLEMQRVMGLRLMKLSRAATVKPSGKQPVPMRYADSVTL